MLKKLQHIIQKQQHIKRYNTDFKFIFAQESKNHQKLMKNS
ncbi:MAG: hypothetical protein ACJAUH_002452 [Saprospiraceae bacterium]|jgi:hypothetical protein|tara:strand:+ start:90 stop:212 length:123 start_codon:yes stop_codon:yes gene_type:complete